MFTVSVTRPENQQEKFHNMTASSQWASRPASERFWNVPELRKACHNLYMNSEERIAPVKRLEVVVAGALLADSRKQADLALYNKDTGGIVRLNNWSFAQLCTRLGAPANYLRKLAPEDVAALLNKYGIGEAGNDDTLAVWRHRGELVTNGPTVNTALAVTSEKYGRIPNYQVCDALLELGADFCVPPARPNDTDPRARPATAEDILKGNKMGLSIREGDIIAPAGCYGDDRSMFVFMVNENKPVEVSEHETFYRGFYVENSEVGNSALRITAFDYIAVCGNHIIWDCKNVQEISLRHIGRDNIMNRFRAAWGNFRKHINADSSQEIEAYRTALNFKLGNNSAEVVDFVAERVKTLSKKAIASAYELAEKYAHIHGSPNTAWGIVSGLTRLSQTLPHADARAEMDRSARKIMLLSGAFNR